jgi:hypothetical protein
MGKFKQLTKCKAMRTTEKLSRPGWSPPVGNNPGAERESGIATS